MLEQSVRVSGATISWSLTPTNREALGDVLTPFAPGEEE